MASFTVYAAYYASDGFEWQQQVLMLTLLRLDKFLCPPMTDAGHTAG